MDLQVETPSVSMQSVNPTKRSRTTNQSKDALLKTPYLTPYTTPYTTPYGTKERNPSKERPPQVKPTREAKPTPSPSNSVSDSKEEMVDSVSGLNKPADIRSG